MEVVWDFVELVYMGLVRDWFVGFVKAGGVVGGSSGISAGLVWIALV